MQNFDYLKDIPGLAELHSLCELAETRQYSEPDSSAINARKALEWLVKAIYKMKNQPLPERVSLLALTTADTYADFIADEKLMAATHWIRKVGNIAAHDGNVKRTEAFFSVLNLYNLVGGVLLKLRVLDNLAPFDKDLLPVRPPRPRIIVARQLQPTAEDFSATVEPQKVTEAPNVVPAVSWEGISEAETRRRFIDLMLREAGWEILATDGDKQPSKACIEIEVSGMSNPTGKGYADYVLFGADSKPLAVIEAKRTSTEPEKGRHQVELYADCLEREYGMRPVIYYTNGFEVKIIDGLGYPPRPLLGFHSEKDLQWLHYQRKHRKSIADLSVKDSISDRAYQKQAIRSICEHLNGMHRRGLLVMATGTGKTRTAISLVDVLDRAGWVKNTLFLADRTSLVDQAARAFTKLLPNHTSLKLSDNSFGDDKKDFNARLVFSTYQTMINYVEDEEKRFTPGRFDLIIIDEAHRSVFGKYGSIFSYFDSFLIGLTATPREEVARSTYDLLGLDEGLPNFAYELDEAVADGFLVPYIGFQRGSGIVNNGIKYDDLSDEEKRQIEEITEYEGLLDPDGKPVGRDIDSPEIYRYIFNVDTVDKVLQDLMANGLRINNGEMIGKTIIFAFNHKHAEMIVHRFHALYPESGPDFCRLIDNYEKYADDLILRFSERDKLPQIAVSVDMLDTGIDVPDALNLVFFKRVRSRIKFMQMIGRGTRLSPGVFGPDGDKKEFYIFDWCGNFAFFGQNPKGKKEMPQPLSMTERIFGYRTDIAQFLQSAEYQVEGSWTRLWHDELKTMLREQVEGLNDNHPKVREQWESVARFRNPKTWSYISLVDVHKIKNDIAPLLPKTTVDLQALVMDILALRVQLSMLDESADGAVATDKIIRIAENLQKRASIPQVAAKMETINEVLTDGFWDSATLEDVERIRKELRELMKFLQGDGGRKFEVNINDTVTDEGIAPQIRTRVSYKQKVISFLAENRDHPVLQKIQGIEQLSQADIDELEHILWSELGTKEEYDKHLQREQLQCGDSVGAFIRTLVAVDREKALKMFSEFISQVDLNSEQMEFLKSILDYVCLNGDMPVETLITTDPFKEIGLAQLFPGKAPKVAEFVRRLHELIIAA
ncbi:DEAD/DEAH box helicase family protein [Muribaculum intestinale]|uniref:DEAD/DEAH box helicase family protein n=1 Tax=Muribaculum intestinale TaxID=1796646 RepID=UPI00261A99CA|nr:DEAD/DEAH box helicase family protein [Muribaculum intestinale]